MLKQIINIPRWNIYLTILGIIIPAGILLIFAKNVSKSTKITIVLMYIIDISGFLGIVNSIGPALFADSIAKSIGLLAIVYEDRTRIIALKGYIFIPNLSFTG
jgi:hypothetical protein